MGDSNDRSDGRRRRRVLGTVAAGMASVAGCARSGEPVADTPEPGERLVADEFEGSEIDTDTWTVDPGDDETLDVTTGQLKCDSPFVRNETARLRSDSVDATGTVELEAAFKLRDPDSWNACAVALFAGSPDTGFDAVELTETSDTDRTALAVTSITDGSRTTERLGGHTDTTDWRAYTLTVDLDGGRVTGATRGNQSFDVDLAAPPTFADGVQFGITVGPGVSASYDWLKLRRLP